MPMSQAEWIEKNLAAAPPLSQAQLAVLRPIFAPVVPLMQRTASATATTEAARPDHPSPETKGSNRNAQR